MSKIGRVLQQSGYKVFNSTYPSTKKSIEELSLSHIPQELKQASACTTVHFVTHSMGGILLRHYLTQHNIPNLGKVVMLGPPNKGSQVVDRLGNMPGFILFNGPAGLQLGTEESSIPNQLGPATYDVGIIAGTRSINPLLSLLLPGKNDGKVTVENTRLEGMRDHIELPVVHPLMMNNDAVIGCVLNFFKNRRFA